MDGTPPPGRHWKRTCRWHSFNPETIMTATQSSISQKQSQSPPKADAIRLLKADHRQVKDYFHDFERAKSASKKQDLANKICKALTVHTKIEEEIFYPAARKEIKDGDLLDEAEVEHATAKQLIAEIQKMKSGDRLFDAKVTVLGEYVNHHVAEEEKELFPEVRETDIDLKDLGRVL